MLNKIIWFWNLLYYYMFKLISITQNIFTYPIRNIITYPIRKFVELFYEIPFIKKGLLERGATEEGIQGIATNTVNNPASFNSTTLAGVKMSVLFMVLQVSFILFIQALVASPKVLFTYIYTNTIGLYLTIFIMVAPGILFNQYVLYKNKRYLTYFKEFSEFSVQQNNKYKWIFILFILFVLLLAAGTFKFVLYKCSIS